MKKQHLDVYGETLILKLVLTLDSISSNSAIFSLTPQPADHAILIQPHQCHVTTSSPYPRLFISKEVYFSWSELFPPVGV